MSSLNPVVAVIQPDNTNAWAVMPCDNALLICEGIDMMALSHALGAGETYVVGQAENPDAFIVNLRHSDTPQHLPNRNVACAAYAAFCFHRGLDASVDAHENLTNYMISSDPLTCSAVVNWLRNFIEAFDELEA